MLTQSLHYSNQLKKIGATLLIFTKSSKTSENGHKQQKSIDFLLFWSWFSSSRTYCPHAHGQPLHCYKVKLYYPFICLLLFEVVQFSYLHIYLSMCDF